MGECAKVHSMKYKNIYEIYMRNVQVYSITGHFLLSGQHQPIKLTGYLTQDIKQLSQNIEFSLWLYQCRYQNLRENHSNTISYCFF